MDSINCFGCKSWNDRDKVIYYEDEGLYRCFECAYKHASAQQAEYVHRNVALRSLLSDAMKAAETVIRYDEAPPSGVVDHNAIYDNMVKQAREVAARIKATLTGGE